jgi:hypothetical protein
MDSNENRPDFALILTDGAQRIEGSTRITISRDDSPDLTLPTGRLAASGFGYGAPFVETVPPGTYSTAVFVENIAALEDDGVTEKYDFEEFAALRITIVDVPIASWERAMVDYPDRADGGSNAFFVDGGIGIVCDASLAETFHKLDDATAPLQQTGSVWLAAGVVDAETGANALCAFYGGDGVHASWIGRSADGSIACFVVV